MLDLIFRNAATPEGLMEIGIQEGVITTLSNSISESSREEIDATGLMVWPGIIDAHVHFNEPGRTDWEGISTGSRALAAGGGTCYFDMPLNAHPPTINVPAFQEKLALALEKSVIDFALWGGLVPGNEADMEPLAEAGVIGFKAFMSGSGMEDFERADETVLKKGMQRAAALGLPVAVHAEDEELTGRLRNECLAAGKFSVRDYLNSRPVQAELNAIEMAVNLAGETGCSLHVVHVSSPEGLAKIAAAKFAGVDVTAETCPHFLLLCDEDVERIGAAAKCAPPIRDRERQSQLWRDLAAGMIDTVGSDHSPSPGSMKQSSNFFEVWGGIAGCQHTFSLFISDALEKWSINPKLVSQVLSRNVARRFGLRKRKGSIAVGQDADLIFLQHGGEHKIEASSLFYRHPISTYVGFASSIQVVRTLSRGRTVWDGKTHGESGFARLIRP